jgi:ABC-2 type transport system permease protein
VSLYRAETRRLVKRRFTKFLVLGALVVLAAVAAGMFFTNQKIGPAQLAAAQARAEAEYQQQNQFAVQQRQECEAAKGTTGGGQYPPDCSEITGPTRDNFDPQWYVAATFDFRKNFGDMVTTMAGVLALVAFVVGASYVGAEWNSGGMMNLLLWRPKRIRVLGTKLLALLAGLAALTVVVAAAWTGLFLLIAQFRGTSASMTPGAWQSFGIMEARAFALVLAAGAIGFALASLGRHTATAFGVAIGVVVLLQVGLGTVLQLAKVKFVEMYLIPFWIQAWLDKSVTFENYDACNYSVNGGCLPDTMSITWQMAGSALAAAVVLVVGAAMWTMRSRDIT